MGVEGNHNDDYYYHDESMNNETPGRTDRGVDSENKSMREWGFHLTWGVIEFMVIHRFGIVRAGLFEKE